MYASMAQRRANIFIIAPTLFCSLASALTIKHFDLPRDLVGRSIKDEYTPHDPPFNWYALGDSYTAGPGAGAIDPSNKADCVRSVGSYGPQLRTDWLYDSSNAMNFLACTGDVTNDMIKNQLPEVSSEPAPDLAILTIGGNDIGFNKIAESCLVGLVGKAKCDDLIKEARDTFAGDDFKNRIKKIYDGIFDQMPKDFHYQILHLGYSQFFNADDDSTWCNDQTFGKVPFSGLNPPKLTLELRRKMNQLSFDLNLALYSNLLGYSNDKSNNPDRETAIKNGWLTQRIWFGNIDGHAPNFNGHRFCEKGQEDPQFGGANTWIFGVWGPQLDVGPDDGNTASSGNTPVGVGVGVGAATVAGVAPVAVADALVGAGPAVGAEAFANIDAASCGQDPSYAHDQAFAWDCDMASYYANSSNDHSVTTIPGVDFTRSFHPKTRGFTAIKDFIQLALSGMRKAPARGSCMPIYQPDTSPPLPAGIPTNLCLTANGFATAL